MSKALTVDQPVVREPISKSKRSPSMAGKVAVELPRFDLRHMTVKLIGDSHLICHAWSGKAIGHMLAKQTKQPKEAKEAKNPHQDYLDSLYPVDGGRWGFPATGFKTAAVDACSHVDGITKVEARGAFHIDGTILPLEGKPEMREDAVRLSMGVADIRYRGHFLPWSVILPIRYNASVLSAGQIIHLFNIAGFAIGVGEWRPQKDGAFGMFHVAEE